MSNAGMGEEGLVAAVQRGERGARAALAEHLLPLVYNVVGRASRRRPDLDHVVREAVLEVIGDRSGPGPESGLRAWAAGVSLRAAVQPPARTVGPEECLMEFEDPATLRPRVSAPFRRLVQAGRWLDEEHGIVWSLWWLEAAGELTRGDLVSALGSTPDAVEYRVQDMLGQLERAREVVGALAASRCGDLAWCTAGWDGRLDAHWRERVAAHVRECADCSASLPPEQIPPELLVVENALVPVPASLADSVAAACRDEDPGPPAARHRAARHAPPSRRRPVLGLAAAVVAAALGVTYASLPADRAEPAQKAAGATVPSATASATVSASPSASASASPSASPSPKKSKKSGADGEPGEKKTATTAPAATEAAGTGASAGCGSRLASRWADWPMPDAASGSGPHRASYTVLGDEAVRDDVTCLTWQRSVAPRAYTFEDARSYCENLGLDGGGWHLPTRIELMSLVDTTRSGPAIDTSAFPGTPAQYFWTSTPWAVEKTPLRAWIINFYEGLTSNAADQSGAYQVRCVRGGAGTARPSYSVSGGQVTDPATGLTWQRTAGGSMSVTQADAYCSALTLGGHAWRLPTVKELATLVDDGRVTPAIDRAAFPDTPGTGVYWSASVYAADRSQRWWLSHNDGITSHRSLDGALVRCVR
ncbi:DUF1566 domain-containing protein [Streptomyces sp. NPDC003247]|uniref:Lcl C-terminal domain-containing protein n=1 Tax=Streptomyces sp. NPDC003247 TaxID=3364677 RepID=UPI00367D88A9